MISYFEYNKPEINRYFDWLKEYLKYYPNTVVGKEFIDDSLRLYGLKQSDIQGNKIEDDSFLNIQKEMFSEWVQYYHNHPQLRCFSNQEYFCRFENGRPDEIMNKGKMDFIKLYIPLDKEHLQEGAKLIFNFLITKGVKHSSKVASEIRSDNIVIRLPIYDQKTAQELISYIHKTPYLQQGLNHLNPFVPNQNGIGMVIDDDESNRKRVSYNGIISQYIVEFINSGQVLDATHFENYLKQNCSFPIIQNNLLQNISKETLPIDKKILLDECLSPTLYNYGQQHVISLLNKFLSGDNTAYNSVSRNYKTSQDKRDYRTQLFNNISVEEVKQILFSCYKTGNLALDYIDELINSKKNAIDIVSLATKEKYGQNQLLKALRKYAYEQNPNGFTNGDRGLRINLVTHVKSEELLFYLKMILQQSGYNVANYDNAYILSLYATTLERQMDKKI